MNLQVAWVYTFRYYATDLIDDAEPYDFIVTVDSFENAKGVNLRNVSSSDDLWHPLPYENKPPFGDISRPTTRPIEDDSAIT